MLGSAEASLWPTGDPATPATPGPEWNPDVIADLYNSLIYMPIHALQQNWIDSEFGAWVDDNLINPLPQLLFGQDLIGDGADGISGGSLADAVGGNGGFGGDGLCGFGRRRRWGMPAMAEMVVSEVPGVRLASVVRVG